MPAALSMSMPVAAASILVFMLMMIMSAAGRVVMPLMAGAMHVCGVFFMGAFFKMLFFELLRLFTDKSERVVIPARA